MNSLWRFLREAYSLLYISHLATSEGDCTEVLPKGYWK